MSFVIATGARYFESYFCEKLGRDLGAAGNGWVRNPRDATQFDTEQHAQEFVEQRLPRQAAECRVERYGAHDSRDADLRTLELSAGASIDEIRAAYRRLAMKHHPDRARQDPAATERFQAVKAAYEALTARQ